VRRTEILGEATAPDGSTLTLQRRGDVYAIRTRGVDLMSTRRHHSEERLAELACAPLQEAAAARVLIGGLGFGFSLGTALRILPPDARLTVAEIVPEIIAWNRDPRFPLAGAALADPRVEVLNEDVLEVLRRSVGTFDAVVLDVDNGPEALTTDGNAAIYSAKGLRLAARALRPGGTLAYWSAYEDHAFAARIRSAGLEVQEVRARAHATSGPMHTLFIARQRPQAR
jgi:spermidine synthase